MVVDEIILVKLDVEFWSVFDHVAIFAIGKSDSDGDNASGEGGSNNLAVAISLDHKTSGDTATRNDAHLRRVEKLDCARIASGNVRLDNADGITGRNSGNCGIRRAVCLNEDISADRRSERKRAEVVINLCSHVF